jgi:molybdopterin synthase catalytic subunit
LKPGEPIVLAAVAAQHRAEAFAACDFLMDHLKTKAPFWKQERRGARTDWVDAKASDDAAAKRWEK